MACAVKTLKSIKAPSSDGLLAEHLKAGGEAVLMWLVGILNATVELEIIPNVMKCGVVVPVYKGAGKDPFSVDSYGGITLSSVLTKVLEFLLLERLELIVSEKGLPHVNQSAYRKRISCADAIFATQESIVRYVKEGSQVFMCLYDVQKAFDSGGICSTAGKAL